MLVLQIVQFAFTEVCSPRWITDDGIEAAVFEDLRKFIVPVEGIDAGDFVIGKDVLPSSFPRSRASDSPLSPPTKWGETYFGNIGGDEGVAALDIFAEVGEGALAEFEFGLDGVVGLAFEDFEEQGEFRDFDGLRVNIHTEDVRAQDTFALAQGEAIAFIDVGADIFLMLGGAVVQIVFQIPIEKILVSFEQERTGTAGGIEDTEFGDFLWSFILNKRADRVLHDVIDDIRRGVVNAAGFLDFGLVHNLSFSPSRNGYDFAEELLVDLAENFHRNDGILILVFRFIQSGNDLPQRFFFDLQLQGEQIGLFGAIRLLLEIEQTGVIALIGMSKEIKKALISALSVDELFQLTFRFHTSRFTDTEEENAVNDAAHGKAEGFGVQFRIQGGQ